MRVLFLTLYPETAASPRYRVLQFLPYLREHGVECVVASALTAREFKVLTGPHRRLPGFAYHVVETPRRIRQLLGASRFDVVFVQKALTTAYLRGMERLLFRARRPVVYDIDDAVHVAPPHSLPFFLRVFEDRGQVKRIIAGSKLVLAGNAWLAGEAERLGGENCHVFPTVVDTDRFSPAPTPPDAFRVGWIGNSSTTASLEVAAETLNDFPGAEVRLVGADPKRNPIRGAEVVAWSPETEVDSIRSFSVGVMPLPKTEWSKGKCALKALQYMACGVPCVATPFGAVADIIRHGENGLFADSPGEWSRALEELRDPALRRRIGDAGRATVEQRYSLESAAPGFLKSLETVV